MAVGLVICEIVRDSVCRHSVCAPRALRRVRGGGAARGAYFVSCALFSKTSISDLDALYVHTRLREGFNGAAELDQPHRRLR